MPPCLSPLNFLSTTVFRLWVFINRIPLLLSHPLVIHFSFALVNFLKCVAGISPTSMPCYLLFPLSTHIKLEFMVDGIGSNQIADGKWVGARRWRAYRSSSSDIPILSLLSMFISSTQPQKTLEVYISDSGRADAMSCQLILKVGVPYNPQFPTGGFGCG